VCQRACVRERKRERERERNIEKERAIKRERRSVCGMIAMQRLTGAQILEIVCVCVFFCLFVCACVRAFVCVKDRERFPIFSIAR